MESSRIAVHILVAGLLEFLSVNYWETRRANDWNLLGVTTNRVTQEPTEMTAKTTKSGRRSFGLNTSWIPVGSRWDSLRPPMKLTDGITNTLPSTVHVLESGQSESAGLRRK